MMKLMSFMVMFCILFVSMCEANGVSFLVEITRVELNSQKTGKQKLTIENIGRESKFIQASDNDKLFVQAGNNRCVFYADSSKFNFKSSGLLHNNIDTIVDVRNFVEFRQEYIWYFKDKEFAYVIPVSWQTAFENSERVSSHLTRGADKVYVRIYPSPSTYDFFKQKGYTEELCLAILTHAAKCGNVDSQRLLGVWNARKYRNERKENYKNEAETWLKKVKTQVPDDIPWIDLMLSISAQDWRKADVIFDGMYGSQNSN